MAGRYTRQLSRLILRWRAVAILAEIGRASLIGCVPAITCALGPRGGNPLPLADLIVRCRDNSDQGAGLGSRSDFLGRQLCKNVTHLSILEPLVRRHSRARIDPAPNRTEEEK